MVELLHIFKEAEENAATREARYRERELELEAQATERENRREERMMMMMMQIQSQMYQQHPIPHLHAPPQHTQGMHPLPMPFTYPPAHYSSDSQTD